MTIKTTLAALASQIIDAGTRRDGSATLRVEMALDILLAMTRDAADIGSARRIYELQRRAYRALAFCRIHDAAARGEIDGGAEYRDALAATREADRAAA